MQGGSGGFEVVQGQLAGSTRGEVWNLERLRKKVDTYIVRDDQHLWFSLPPTFPLGKMLIFIKNFLMSSLFAFPHENEINLIYLNYEFISLLKTMKIYKIK